MGCLLLMAAAARVAASCSPDLCCWTRHAGFPRPAATYSPTAVARCSNLKKEKENKNKEIAQFLSLMQLLVHE